VKNFQRYLQIDLIRSIAIMMMLLSHCIDFFYNGNNLVVKQLNLVLVLLSFTFFLFVFGASLYISYLSKHPLHNNKKLSERALILVIVFFTINFFVIYFDNRSQSIYEIFTFQYIANYSEFLITFIILIISTRYFVTSYLLLLSKPIYILVCMVTLFILGLIMYGVNIPEYFVGIKSLFVGHRGMYRFPILFYFLVFIIGMHYGKSLLKQSSNIYKNIVILLMLSYMFVSFVSIYIDGINSLSIIKRWPPNINFIIIGLLALILILKFFDIFANRILKFKSIIIKLSQNALNIYLIHVLLLYLYKFFVGYKIDQISIIPITFFVLILICFAIIYIKDKLTLKTS
jgi:hypothetical protein